MILLAILLIPLLAALASASTSRERVSASVTITGSVAALGLAVWSAGKVLAASRHLFVAIPHWIALDPLGALILVLIAAVATMAAIFTVGYMDFTKSGGVRKFYANFNLFIFSMLAIPLIQEPNLVWVAIEATTLFSVFLVGFDGTHDALEAAWKYLILTVMGASIALLGFLVLYWAARESGRMDFTWAGLSAGAATMSPTLLKASFLLILVGLGAKIGLVPLHTWLPDAHSQAPTPVCALLSGVETTAVLYILLRLLPILSAAPSIHAKTWMLAFGLLSVGTAAFLLITVRDYKRLFAFSTVEHMGIILVAVGLGGGAAHQAAMLQIVAHAFTKSFAFFAAGAVFLVMGTREIASVRGLLRRSPLAGAALLVAGLAVAGAPPFALFLSEFSVAKAGLHPGGYLWVSILVLFIAVAFAAISYHVTRMVFGPGPAEGQGGGEKTDSPESLPWSVRLTIVVAAAPVVLLGLYVPGPLQRLIVLAAAALGG